MQINNDALLAGECIGTLKASRRRYKIIDRMGSSAEVKVMWLDTKKVEELNWSNLISSTDNTLEQEKID
jgi:hypothetical protein